MSDEDLRRALAEKLSDPNWQARQERRYREIVGESEIRFAPAPARLHPNQIPLPPPAPLPEEPKNVADLWLGNWQRSHGALTITRFPDNTAALDHAAGGRTLFRPAPASRGRYTWRSETTDGRGRVSESYRSPERYASPEEALLEMHRAALEQYALEASETEG